MAQGEILDSIRDIAGIDHVISPLAENVRYSRTITKPNGTQVDIGNAKQAFDNIFESGANSTGDNTNVGIQNLPLGKFVYATGANAGWLIQKDYTTPSSHGVTYKFKLPKDIVAKVYHQTNNSSSNVTAGSYSDEISNGGTFTFDESNNIQRILFARKSNGGVASLTAAEVEQMVANGEIAVMYEEYDVNIRNMEKESLVTWAKRKNGATANYPRFNRAVICHISDTHGDSVRTANALKFARFHGVDDVIHTGDADMYKGQGISYVFENSRQIGQHTSFCLGNHESYSNSGQSGYIDLMSEYGLDHDYVMPDTFKGYYYHDIAGKNIRIISLNLYEDATFSGGPNSCKVTQTQLEWFVDALKSTPDNYGVIVVMHQWEGYATNSYLKALPEASKFNDTVYTDWSVGNSSASETPIRKIVDAFIRHTSYEFNYDGYYSVSVNFTADFTELGENAAQFVCYLVGHSHGDGIALANISTSRQVVMRVTSGNALQRINVGNDPFAFSGGDMLRYGRGVAQDAFNLIGIDLTEKTLRIVRIGSDLNVNLSKRDYVEISFAQTTE